MVTNSDDIDKLWKYLKDKALIQEDMLKPQQGNLTSKSMTGSFDSLNAVLADEKKMDRLSLELLQEGNTGDKKARRARLIQSLIALILDVAKVRIITFTVQDTNVQSIDRLEAGLAVRSLYNYQKHFECTPANLEGTSAAKWEHFRSYLFNSKVNYDTQTHITTEISSTFNYQYDINNTIGQWEDWEASLAIELNPKSATDGAVLNTTDSSKLATLQPTEKGLSVEAWIKPSSAMNHHGSILYYEKGGQSYSLGIEKDSSNTKKYKCVATLGGKKYTSSDAFPFQNTSENEQWRHLAFTHKKYWGFELESGKNINCGNDSSLQLKDEFTLEVLVKVDASGTLLEKEGEYALSINSNMEVIFNWAGTNCLEEWNVMSGEPSPSEKADKENYKIIKSVWNQKNKPQKLDALNSFYKITLIRSKNKPQTEPTKAEYPITGSNQAEAAEGTGAGSKWYKEKENDEILEGMAEKQDQMENRMNLSQTNMLGNSYFGGTADQSQSPEANPKYYHTLIITNSNNSSKEWTTTIPIEIEGVEAYKALMMGGKNFAGVFASVRIWNRALSISEAKALPVPENKFGLLSYWRIAEGKGKYLYDEVSENHGVADRGKWTDSPQSNQIGQFQFYVDGIPQKHEKPEDGGVQGVDQFSIGGVKKAAGFTNYFKGTLEEIRIWNVPRTNEQITDNAFGRLKGSGSNCWSTIRLISLLNRQVIKFKMLVLTVYN